MAGWPHRELNVRAGTLVDGKYRVVRILGQGATGMVLLAEDEGLNRQVALKFVSCPDPELAEEFYNRFRNEALGMAALQHPNVVQIFAYGEHYLHPYFVMEYVPGSTLRALIRPEQPLHVDVAMGIMRQVCDGLAAVHEQGVVHRDVKPENMLIGPRYRVAVTDFGVAQMMQHSSGDHDRPGTPHYLAPEAVNSAAIPAEQRHLIDIYALGVVAYELLAGRRPFESDNVWAVMSQHQNEEPPAASSICEGLSPAFDPVLARAMAKAPAERYQSCDELYRALIQARFKAARGETQGDVVILVVDDDPTQRTIYRAVFEAAFADACVESAEDGLVAYELAKAHRPDLIIVDLNMPQLDGMELCAVLKSTEELAAAPIVVISGEVTPHRKQALHELGVSDVRSKPVPPRELVTIARQFLG